MRNGRTVKTTVLPGGRIELTAPDLKPGQAVEVTIRCADDETPKRSALDILAEASGRRIFNSAAEVDTYIRAERDAWDR